MAGEHLLTFHESAYRESLKTWLSRKRQATLEISEEEAAYSTLEHASLWFRAKGDAGIPDELCDMALKDKTRLVYAACRSASEFELPSHLQRLLRKDLLEPEDIEEFEHVLMQIDGLDAVVDFADTFVASALEDDQKLLSKLAQTRCVVANLVQQLSERPDILAVASRLVLVQRDVRYLDGDRPADWFTRIRNWDKELSRDELLDIERALDEVESTPVPVVAGVTSPSMPVPALLMSTNDTDASLVMYKQSPPSTLELPSTRSEPLRSTVLVTMAKAYVKTEDWLETRRGVQKEDFFRKKSPEYSDRTYRKLKSRLTLLTRPQLDLFGSESLPPTEGVQLAWLAYCKQYKGVYQFAKDVVSKKYRDQDLAVSKSDFVHFLEKLFSGPEIRDIKPEQRDRLPGLVMKVLGEAGIVVDNTIQKTNLSDKIAAVIESDSKDHFTIFPGCG